MKVEGLTLHRSVTADRVAGLVEADRYAGVCVTCGEERDGCEPDARRYPCESCGARAVYGAEELLFHLVA